MDKREHLLSCLAEECSEVQKAVSKALRFGLDDGYPASNSTNQGDIEDELIDILAVVELLYEHKAIRIRFIAPEFTEAIRNKKKKVCEYMEYAKERGTLVEVGKEP